MYSVIMCDFQYCKTQGNPLNLSESELLKRQSCSGLVCFSSELACENTVKLQLLEHRLLVYRGWFEDCKSISNLPYFAFWPGAMINTQWLELPISRTVPWSQRCSSHWSWTKVVAQAMAQLSIINAHSWCSADDGFIVILSSVLND